MAGIDQVLSFVVQQGANELRLGTDEEPQVFAMGARRRFTMSPTSDEVLRQLLGDILSHEREEELKKQRRSAFDYEASGIGRFQVILSARPGSGMNVTFIHSAKRASSSAGRPASFAKPAPTALGADATVAPISNFTQPEASAESTTHEVPKFNCSTQLLELVERASMERASDIHLADGQMPYLRVDGRLRVVTGVPTTDVSELFGLDSEAKSRVMCGSALELGLELSPRERLRVSLYRMQAGLAAAIRLLAPSAPSLSELNLPLPLQGLAELPHGLVLLCGATGSGKSSTLAALSRHALERRSVLLVTLEDPIEFLLSTSSQSIVRQRQIGRDVADFTRGLRDALRGDPDVIMVGELRDPETIRLALTAAETGHLVLASLHAGSAAACVERVVDAYPAEQRSQIRVQLADALRAVVVQKLLPRARGNGRVAALEVLRVTHGVANVIREGKTAQIGTMLQGGKRDGMVSLERCLAEYVQSGLITADQAKSAANDQDSLTMYLTK
jgi:twitching motility protein PilT